MTSVGMFSILLQPVQDADACVEKINMLKFIDALNFGNKLDFIEKFSCVALLSTLVPQGHFFKIKIFLGPHLGTKEKTKIEIFTPSNLFLSFLIENDQI